MFFGFFLTLLFQGPGSGTDSNRGTGNRFRGLSGLPYSLEVEGGHPNVQVRAGALGASIGRYVDIRADVLWRNGRVHTQRNRGVNREVRIAQEFAGEEHYVRLAITNDVIGLLWGSDQTDGACRDAGFPPDAFGKLHLKPWTDRN